MIHTISKNERRVEDMKKFLFSVFANTIALVLIDYLSKSVEFTGGINTVIILAIIVSFLNMTIKPILQFLSFPVSVITLGLFHFIVNGAVVFMAFNMTDGATISGLGPAVFVSIALSLMTGFIESTFGQKE